MNSIDEQKEKLTNPESITISFSDITYKVSNKRKKREKVILNNVCGAFHPKRLTAILGPSGAGKTSLMNILVRNKKTDVTGNILVNGYERNFDEFQWKTSYIAQECSLLPSLTVKETLMMAAEMKLSQNTEKNKKIEIINDIATLLGLQKSISTRVANLSGGEVKRLSIGIELVTNPPIMFFDEPTSGLDSFSSLQVISYLRTLASKGHTVICVIHQPSSKLFSMFDDLLIMSNGRSIYNGPIDNMIGDFASAGFECPHFYNRADFALEVASGEIDGDLEMLISKTSSQNVKCERNDVGMKFDSSEGEMHGNKCTENNMHEMVSLNDIEKGVKSDTCASNKKKKITYATSSWYQFKQLLKRSTISTIRDPQLARVKLLGHVFIGALLSSLYYGIGNDGAKVTSNASLTFFLMMFVFYANAMLAVLTIPAEAAVIRREQLNNWYSVTAYFFSKLIVDIGLQIICPTMCLVIVYFFTNQPSEFNRFFMVWLIIILLGIISQVFGLLMGVLFTPAIGVFLLSMLAQPMFMFSGFFLKFDEIPVYYRFFTFLSCFGYGFEALLLALYDYDRPRLDCSVAFCYFKSPQKFLDEMDAVPGNYYKDVIALLIYLLVYLISLYISMHYRLWKSRRI